ncbi:MAG: hypothetical protein FWH12_02415 [Treponema sp.]|nr:hypothetical protein [Treponema sp.]
MGLWENHVEGVEQLIDINPVSITWDRYPVIDNGRGVMVPDPSAPPEKHQAWVRLSHQAGGVQDTSVASVGLTTNKSMYLLMLYNVDLRKDEIITVDFGPIRTWKVGVVDELFVEGECYAKQAPLVRADG